MPLQPLDETPGTQATARRRTEALTFAAFALAAIIIPILSIYAFWISYEHAQARKFVNKSQNVLATLADVETTLIDIDSRNRGYIITGNDIYLTQNEALLAHMKDAIRQLRTEMADFPDQQAPLQKLDADIQARIAATRTFTDARRLQGLDAARDLIIADIPVRQAAAVRNVLQEIEKRQNALLQTRNAALDSSIQRFGLAVGVLVTFLAVLLTFLFLVIRHRQAAEQQLRQTEQRFRVMADSITEYAILLLDTGGRITTWSPGAQRIKGYAADEIVGRHFSCFYLPADVTQGKPERALETAASTGRFEDEGWRMRKDGARFWAYVAITALRDESGVLQGYAKVTRDMSGHKAAEEALRTEIGERKQVERKLQDLNTRLEQRVLERTSELETSNVQLEMETAELKNARTAIEQDQERLRGILDSAMDAIITVDDNENVVLFNAAAEKIFGYSSNRALGMSLRLFLPERFRAAHAGHIQRFAATGVTSRRMGGERIVTGLRRDGSEFPIEASISQISESGKKFYTVVLRDVTERRSAQEALERSEARLRGILDSAMDAIVTVDESQSIVLFNTAAEAVFGCPRDEAIGTALDQFIPQRFRGAHTDHIRRFSEVGTASRRMGAQRIVTGLRRNGEEFPIEASISQITEHGHKFFTVILRDVTARMQTEQALRASKDELRELASAAHTVREQEKSRIARELHDELAQSLTSLKMDLASIKAELSPPQQSLLDKLETMQTMVDGMVTATRRIAADLRPLMLDDLGLVPAAEWLAQNFTRRTGIRCQFSVDPPELQLQDPHATAIFRILQESLTNIGRHAQATLVEVTLDGSDGRVVLRVRDNGLGFDPGLPRKSGSLGLVGLRERANLLGGEISIDAAPGRGTVIEVQIPLEDTALSS